jgi:hypothetical protein
MQADTRTTGKVACDNTKQPGCHEFAFGVKAVGKAGGRPEGGEKGEAISSSGPIPGQLAQTGGVDARWAVRCSRAG